MPEQTMIEKVVEAWHDEYRRWLSRDARFLGLGFQVCREDDSGYAGEFSEAHSFKNYKKCEAAFDKMRNTASARAAIAASGLLDLLASCRLALSDLHHPKPLLDAIDIALSQSTTHTGGDGDANCA